MDGVVKGDRNIRKETAWRGVMMQANLDLVQFRSISLEIGFGVADGVFLTYNRPKIKIIQKKNTFHL